MKKLGILILFLTSPLLGATDFKEKFYEQFKSGDFATMESTLRDWERTCPGDADMLEAYGDFYYNRSKKGLIENRSKLTSTEDILLSGQTPSRNYSDRNGMLKAAGYWKKAVQLNPWRLDLSFWLARLYQDLDDFEAQYQTLAETLQYADKNKKKLQWGPNRSLPQKPSQFIPAAMQDYENYYFAQQSQAAAEKAFHLARLSVTFFPNDSSTYNSMAAYYWFKNDWEHALKYLILATQKNPRNGLVLNNLGNTLAKMGKKREAKIYYRKVVDLDLDEEYVANAKRRLEELSGD